MTSVTYQGSRDPRFVTRRRGGLLDDETHHLLVLWGAACAERVLSFFQTACPGDSRPEDAVETARQWAARTVTMKVAREYAFAAHAAARSADGAASEAARAAGHAVATAHMADHELGAAFYSLRALRTAHPADESRLEEERDWQLSILPQQISSLVMDDMRRRAKKFQNSFNYRTSHGSPHMTGNSAPFRPTNDELRAVTRFAVESAQEVLAIFESIRPDDDRPRTAIEAAWLFVNGAPRTNLQRATAVSAHRAANETDEQAALYAARAAGDAAAAPYLHPLPKAAQVGHILRATACAARSAELKAGTTAAAEETLRRAQRRATPQLLRILRHYPSALTGKQRVTQLMTSLDQRLRAT